MPFTFDFIFVEIKSMKVCGFFALSAAILCVHVDEYMHGYCSIHFFSNNCGFPLPKHMIFGLIFGGYILFKQSFMLCSENMACMFDLRNLLSVLVCGFALHLFSNGFSRDLFSGRKFKEDIANV